MVNYILSSLFFHVFLAVLLVVPRVNTIPPTKIEVTLIQKDRKQQKQVYQVKHVKLGKPPGAIPKGSKIDLKDYADQLKALVDPIFVENLIGKKYAGLNIIVLLSVSRSGMITNVTVKKSSGNRGYDELAVKTFWQVKKIPKPPEELVKLGIIWELST